MAGLLPNPGFEEGLTGWRPSTESSLLTLRTNLSMQGRNSARIAVGPDAGTGVVGLASDPSVPATVGQLFCAEAYVSSGANRAIGVQIMNGLNSTSPRDAPGASAIPGVGWARLRASHVATVQAPGVWVRVTTLSPPPNMVFHADEVRLWSPDGGSCF